jgi:hypothetical protein
VPFSLKRQCDRTLLPQVCRHLAHRATPSGEELCCQGEVGDTFYVIIRGSVRIRSGPPRGGKATFVFSIGTQFCMTLWYGRAGRLTTQNGGFRPRRAG